MVVVTHDHSCMHYTPYSTAWGALTKHIRHILLSYLYKCCHYRTLLLAPACSWLITFIMQGHVIYLRITKLGPGPKHSHSSPCLLSVQGGQVVETWLHPGTHDSTVCCTEHNITIGVCDQFIHEPSWVSVNVVPNWPTDFHFRSWRVVVPHLKWIRNRSSGEILLSLHHWLL